MESYIEVDPHQVLYSQCCIKPTFKDGKLVESTIKKLVNGKLSPKGIKTIRVCTLPSGKMHSLDNRRLYVFKEAIKRGCTFRTVPVIRSKKSNDLHSLKWKMSHSPSEDWSVVTIKTDCRPIFSENNSYIRTEDNAVDLIINIDSRPILSENVLHTKTQDNATNLAVMNDGRPRRSENVLSTRTQDTFIIIDDSRPYPFDSYSSHVENTETYSGLIFGAILLFLLFLLFVSFVFRDLMNTP